MLHHFVSALGREHARVHGLAAGRPLGQPRHLHVAVSRERKRARDGRGRHHQHVDRPVALALQLHAVVHTEAMLLVNHCQREIAERDILGKQCMGADQNVDHPVFKRLQGLLARLSLFASGKNRQAHTGRFRQRLERHHVLAREDFRRRHQRALRAAFHRIQQCGHGDHRLARADIALQQPQHARWARHIRFDLADRLLLRSGEREGQGGERFGFQFASALQHAARLSAHVRAYQHKRQLIGEQFVIGEPHPRWGLRRQIGFVFRRMRCHNGVVERRPAACPQQMLVEPLRRVRHGLQRAAHRFADHLVGKPVGQRIHRLVRRHLCMIFRQFDIIGVDHLQPARVALDAPADNPLGAHWQCARQVVALRAKEHQFQKGGVVGAAHLVGPARIARRQVALDRYLNCRDSSFLRIL